MTDVVKNQLTEQQLADRNQNREIKKMESGKMVKHLRRIARRDRDSFKGTWAVVLAVVLENTKPLGRMEPYLR